MCSPSFLFLSTPYFMPVVAHPRKPNTYPRSGSNHVGAVPSCAVEATVEERRFQHRVSRAERK
jgi:hypothetical protein